MKEPRLQGWKEAQQKFPIEKGQKCEVCHEKEAIEHHHIDGNEFNNNRSNIYLICRKCHMNIDGRSKKLAEQAMDGAKARWGEFTTQCRICGKAREPGDSIHDGRCSSCDSYWRRHDKQEERPYVSVKGSDGRSNLGSNHSHAKLNEDDIRAIRTSDENNCALGRKYGVAANTIKAIKLRKTWTYVK